MTQPAAPAAPEPTPTPAPAEKTPPWADSEFDAERAWKKIQALEADKEKLAKRPVLDDAAKAKLAEFDRLQAANQTELEKAQGELTRWQSEAEKWRTTSVASMVKALAAPEFVSTNDAVKGLDDLAKYLDAGGQIDEAAIKADLATLLEENPHYRRAEQAPAPRAPRPNAAQGSGINGKSAPDPANEFAAIMNSALGTK